MENERFEGILLSTEEFSEFLDNLIELIKGKQGKFVWNDENGKLQTANLSELPLEQAEEIVQGWIRRKVLPVKVIDGKKDSKAVQRDLPET